MSQDDIYLLGKDFAVMKNQMKNMDSNIQDIKQTLHDYIEKEDQRHAERDRQIISALSKKADKDELDSVKGDIKWVVRAIIGTVIAAILSLIFINTK